jgi:hypothetical protein
MCDQKKGDDKGDLNPFPIYIGAHYGGSIQDTVIDLAPLFYEPKLY